MDEYGITSKLSKHSLKTQNDNFEFDLSYKNGVRHLYNPVSFDLMEHESIREKVYKWRGKISEIETASEEIKIHMLLLYPENQNEKDREFINSVLMSSTRKQNLSLLNEKNLASHLMNLKMYLREATK